MGVAGPGKEVFKEGSLGQNNKIVFRYHHKEKIGKVARELFFILNFSFIEKYQILHQNFIFIVNHSKIDPKR